MEMYVISYRTLQQLDTDSVNCLGTTPMLILLNVQVLTFSSES